MSFTVPPAPPARPNRCQLFGPGSRPELFDKMAASASDVINLDLEDSVAPSDKDAARANVVKAINGIDWGKKTLSVRINGLDTEYWYRDVVDLLEQTDGRLDLIMIPKAGNAKDIYAVDALVTAVEAASGKSKRLGFEAIIETAAGLAHVEEIAAASPRMQSLHLGPADYAAYMGMATTHIGGTQSNYYMLSPNEGDGPRQTHYADPWHYPLVAIVAACRTHGLLPVTGRSATSPTPRASAPRRCARPRSAASASGRSTPRRSRSPTRSSRRPRPRCRTPARSWRRWSRPRPRARAPSPTRAS